MPCDWIKILKILAGQIRGVVKESMEFLGEQPLAQRIFAKDKVEVIAVLADNPSFDNNLDGDGAGSVSTYSYLYPHLVNLIKTL